MRMVAMDGQLHMALRIQQVMQRVHTVSYDGAAAYWAQQNAQQKANDFDNEQYVIPNRLTAGYGKANTYRNQEEVCRLF